MPAWQATSQGSHTESADGRTAFRHSSSVVQTGLQGLLARLFHYTTEDAEHASENAVGIAAGAANISNCDEHGIAVATTEQPPQTRLHVYSGLAPAAGCAKHEFQHQHPRDSLASEQQAVVGPLKAPAFLLEHHVTGHEGQEPWQLPAEQQELKTLLQLQKNVSAVAPARLASAAWQEAAQQQPCQQSPTAGAAAHSLGAEDGSAVDQQGHQLACTPDAPQATIDKLQLHGAFDAEPEQLQPRPRAALTTAVHAQDESQVVSQELQVPDARQAAAAELDRLGIPRGSTTAEFEYAGLHPPIIEVVPASVLLQQAAEAIAAQQCQAPGAQNPPPAVQSQLAYSLGLHSFTADAWQAAAAELNQLGIPGGSRTEDFEYTAAQALGTQVVPARAQLQLAVQALAELHKQHTPGGQLMQQDLQQAVQLHQQTQHPAPVQEIAPVPVHASWPQIQQQDQHIPYMQQEAVATVFSSMVPVAMQQQQQHDPASLLLSDQLMVEAAAALCPSNTILPQQWLEKQAAAEVTAAVQTSSPQQQQQLEVQHVAVEATAALWPVPADVRRPPRQTVSDHCSDHSAVSTGQQKEQQSRHLQAVLANQQSQSSLPLKQQHNMHPQAAAVLQQLLDDTTLRGFEGLGAQGGRLVYTARRARPMIAAALVLSGIYVIWRACRSCVGGWFYFFSIPVLLAEIAMGLMGMLFMLGVWNQLERPERWLGDMLLPEDFPAVDVYVVCYTEPPEVVEATVIAALNLNYPGSRLSVHVLDDGNSPVLKDMITRLQFQARYMQRDAELVYIARQKVKCVPHHAKAGNINNALLKETPGHGEYILVLDCDMIVHPDFLMQSLGHFYRWQPTGEQDESCNNDVLDDSGLPVGLLDGEGDEEGAVEGGCPTGSWVLKDKAAFIQTPQDFWNVAPEDPLVHFARFFYGPMLQGRDGIGACPCCGTGVVFRRDVLVSIGGQAYGSITEDYNTAMTLLSAGFSTMFLNERMSFGQAPDDLAGVFKQRLRWAIGAIQILMRDNPLKRPGLTLVQALLFWESAAHHFLAVTTMLLGLLPVVYIFVEVSPVSAERLWEFCVVFCGFYLMNRITMWQLHKSCEGGSQEIWRGSQMWVWMAPNHCKAIWQVMKAEVPLLRWLTKEEIAFKVTQKKARSGDGSAASSGMDLDVLKQTVYHNGPFLVFYAITLAALIWLIARAAMGHYTLWRGALAAVSGGWVLMLCLCMWPPVSTLLPREETDQGWKVRWDLFLPIPQPLKAAASTAASVLGRASVLLGYSHSHDRRASVSHSMVQQKYSVEGGCLDNATPPLGQQPVEGLSPSPLLSPRAHDAATAGSVDAEALQPPVLGIGATTQRRKSLLGLPSSPLDLELLRQQRRSSVSHLADAASGSHRPRRASLVLGSSEHPASRAGRQRRASLQLPSSVAAHFIGNIGGQGGAFAGPGRNRRASLQLLPTGQWPLTAEGSASHSRQRRVSLILPSQLSGYAAAGMDGSGSNSPAEQQWPSRQGGAAHPRSRRHSMQHSAFPLSRFSQFGVQQNAGDCDVVQHGQQLLLQNTGIPLTGAWEVDSAVAAAAAAATAEDMSSNHGLGPIPPHAVGPYCSMPAVGLGVATTIEGPYCSMRGRGRQHSRSPLSKMAAAATAADSASSQVCTTAADAVPKVLAAESTAVYPAESQRHALANSGNLQVAKLWQGSAEAVITSCGAEQQDASQLAQASAGTATAEPRALASLTPQEPPVSDPAAASEPPRLTAASLPPPSTAVQTAAVESGRAVADRCSATATRASQIPYGRVSLPGHSQLARSASALLTGLVLPERPVFVGLAAAPSAPKRSSSGLRSRLGSYSQTYSNLPSRHQTEDNAVGGESWRRELAQRRTTNWLVDAQASPNALGATAAVGGIQTGLYSTDSCSLPVPPGHLLHVGDPATDGVAAGNCLGLYSKGFSTLPVAHGSQLGLHSSDSCSLPMPPRSPVQQHHGLWPASSGSPDTWLPLPPGRPTACSEQPEHEQLPRRHSNQYHMQNSSEALLPTSTAGDVRPLLALARRGSMGPMLVIGPGGELGAAPLTAGVLRATGGGARSSRVSATELAGLRISRTSRESLLTTGSTAMPKAPVEGSNTVLTGTRQSTATKEAAPSMEPPQRRGVRKSMSWSSSTFADRNEHPHQQDSNEVATEQQLQQQGARPICRNTSMGAHTTLPEPAMAADTNGMDSIAVNQQLGQSAVGGTAAAAGRVAASRRQFRHSNTWTAGRPQRQISQQYSAETSQQGNDLAQLWRQWQQQEQGSQESSLQQQHMQLMLPTVAESRSLRQPPLMHMHSAGPAAAAVPAAHEAGSQHEQLLQAGLLLPGKQEHSIVAEDPGVPVECHGQLLHLSQLLSPAGSVAAGAGDNRAHQAIAGLTSLLSTDLTGATCTGSGSSSAVAALLEQTSVGSEMPQKPTAGGYLQRLISVGSHSGGRSSCRSSIDCSKHVAAARPGMNSGLLGTAPDGLSAAANERMQRPVSSAAVGLEASLIAGSHAFADGPVLQKERWDSVHRIAADETLPDGPNLLVVPTEPASIFEASIAARPNFDERQLPPSNYWYMAINGLILVILVCGAIVELVTGEALH